ncbi:hypothetical protein Q5P01_011715 [Channa striata]|uniref:Uncharacterized protein n=1 Tax=Channa striata TaxID=64152 RepID=A0AA88MU59_CHASR|nr:hypothetical protein Q5P01_011715 [Channa striata]
MLFCVEVIPKVRGWEEEGKALPSLIPEIASALPDQRHLPYNSNPQSVEAQVARWANDWLQRLTLAQGPFAAPKAYIGMNERGLAIRGNSETPLSPKMET